MKRSFAKFSVYWGFVIALFATTSNAQFWVEDPSLKPVLTSSNGIGGVSQKLAYPGGRLLVTTNHYVVDGAVTNSWLVLLNPDGNPDPTFNPVEDSGRLLAVYADGRILYRTPSSGTALPQIRRLLPDGSYDPSFTPVPVNSENVNARLFDDGTILLHGEFTQVHGTDQRYLAQINGDGSLDASFHSPFSDALTSYLSDVVPTADGQHLLVVGTSLGLGSGRNNVARLTRNGSVVTDFSATDTSFPYAPKTVYPATDGGAIVAYGVNSLVRLLPNGAQDTSFAPNLVGTIRYFGPQQSDGKVYYITRVYSGSFYLQLRRMNPDGTDDLTFTAITAPDNDAYLMSLPVMTPEGDMYLGVVTEAQLTTDQPILRVSSGGSIDEDFKPRTSHYVSPSRHLMLPDGKRLVAGYFNKIRDVPFASPYNLVRLDTNGIPDAAFAATIPSGSSITKLELQPDGRILAFGSFQLTTDQYVKVVRFEANGAMDSTFTPITGSIGPTAVDANGYIYGSFGGESPNLRRFSPDGQADPSFLAPSTFTAVKHIAPLSDGSVIVAHGAGSYSKYLQRLFHDGTIDPYFDSQFSSDPFAEDTLGLVSLPDGSVLACSYGDLAMGFYLILQRVQPSGNIDFIYRTKPNFADIGGIANQLTTAGVLFDLLCESSPTSNHRVRADFTDPRIGAMIECSTSGQLVLTSSPNSSSSNVTGYRRTELAPPSFDAAPTILQLLPTRADLRPLNYTFGASVIAGGLPSDFQWMKGGVPLPGQANNLYTIQNVEVSDAGTYSVRVTNSYGSVDSDPINLTIDSEHAQPAIISAPVSQTETLGSSVTFSVTAIGNPAPTYQWSFNGVAIAGANQAVLNVPNIQSSSAGIYSVRVSNKVVNAAGSFSSYVIASATLDVSTPVFAKISAGRYHSLWLTTSDQALATGNNASGQLGDGTNISVTSPKVITITGQTITDTAGMAEHSLFLTSTGEVWTAGNNSNGQLGDGTTINRSTPIKLTTGAVGIAGNHFHSAVLKADGTLWTIGGNDSGQLGNSSITDTHTLIHVASGVIDVATGISQTLFLKSDNTLWGMGNMNGNGTPVTTPTQIATDVKTMAAGGYHSLFVKSDDTLWALGWNAYGQLGNGSTTDAFTPVQITTGVRTVAAGFFHSLFIKKDGTLWSMGRNNSGQLGDGTTSNRVSPYHMATNVASVSASEDYTLFTMTDGSLWGTGYNTYGQFGDGTTTTTTSPMKITTGLLPTPDQPTGLNAVTAASFDRVQLTWTPDGNATAYEVWRSSINDSTTATSIASDLRWAFYEDRSISLNQTYYYWIKSVNSSGSSSFSAAAGASTSSVMGQSIIFAGPANQAYSPTPITLSATASSGLAVTFSLLSGPATLDDNQLTLTGTGTVTVRASQAGNANYLAADPVDRSFIVTANALSWLAQHFTASELADASISGPSADPDGDGLTNLLEYALDLNPKSVDTTGQPEMSTSATDWTYTYTRPADRPDLTYEVETSTDLVNWTTTGVTHTMTADHGTTQTWRATVALGSAANVFFRLKITQN